jgi:hypothetical protein
MATKAGLNVAMHIPQRAVIEVELEAGERRVHCWIDADSHVHVGVRITLRDSDNPTILWTVTKILGDPRRMLDLSVLERYQGRSFWG